jgi:GAF domain-containing protein
MDYGDSSLLNGPQVVLSRRIGAIASSRASQDQIVQELVRIVVEVAGCDVCLVCLHDPANGDVIFRATQQDGSSEIEYMRRKLGDGITVWAEQRGIVLMPRDASSHLRFREFSSLLESTFHALLSMPLVGRGEVIGVLNVHHREPHEHTTDEILFMTIVAQQMASAIALSRLAVENARLRAATQEVKKRLEERKVLERAKGVLQERFKLSEEQAYVRLRNESRRSRKPIRELAEAVLLVEGMAPPK